MKHIPSKVAILPLLMALIMIVVANTAVPMPVSAATSGPLNAGTGANVDGPGTVAWTDAGNILADDINYATATIGATATSEYLQGTDYGFSIPLDATINGIAVSIMRMDSSGNGAIDADLHLLKAGAIVGTNYASATKWPTAMTAAAYGGVADLWGTTWTPAEINAAGFGLSLSALNTHPAQNRTASVDYMEITVTYTPAATPSTLTVDAATGTYGGTTSLTATLTVTVGGAPVGGRTISFTLNGNSVGSAATNGSGVATLNGVSLAGIDAGTYPAGVGASFAGDAGYQASSDTDSLTVSRRDITVTADDKSKTYGDADPALTYQVTSGSLVAGDSFTGSLTRVAGENAGGYAIQQGSLAISDGNGGNNYNLTFVDSTLTISKRDITVTADDKSKTCGDADPALTYQITSGSLVGGDSFSGALSRVAGENTGSYAIQQGSLALSSNYNLTFVEGTFTIGIRDITVTADDKGKAYGDSDPALTYQITSGSLLPGDSFSGDIARAAGENVGTYEIEQGTLALNSNYSLTFVEGTLTISTRPVTVTADAKSKVYGNADPALTYQITSGSLVGSDTFSGALSRAAGENVGAYAIQQGTLTLGSNYNITYIGANLSITARPITVTADAKSKVYGESDPALTYQITSGSLAFSDSFSGALSRVAGENAGTYAIEQGTLALNGNYNLTFANGNLTVSPRSLTITASNRSKTFGSVVTFAGTEFTATGLVGSDTVTGVTLTSAGAAASAGAGTYDIVVSAATGSGLVNYAITYITGTLTVDEAIPPAAEPTVTGISPESGSVGETLSVVIEGSNFTGTTAVDFGSGVTVNSFSVEGPNRITVSITIGSDASPGSRNVTVTTPSGDGELAAALRIEENAPEHSSGSWWLWLLIPLLALPLGLLLLFFLWYRRRKKKPLWEVMAGHSYSHLEEMISVTVVRRQGKDSPGD